MKNGILIIIFMLCLYGCNKDTKLTWEKQRCTNSVCTDCAVVNINYPLVLAKNTISGQINKTINEKLVSLINYDDDKTLNTVKDAIGAFQTEYEKMQTKFPEETTPWEADIDGSVIFENKEIVTVKLDSYLFTGGAHGYGTVQYLNFDKTNGQPLKTHELFTDQIGFSAYAETKFREQEKIPLDKNINSTGFMFENDNFYLPENMGFTSTGLQLYYQQYEIASYAEGPILLTFPYIEIQEYLAYQFTN